MDVERLLSSVKDDEGLAQFMTDYEKYKYPDSSNLTYPDAMKGDKNSFVCFKNFIF